MRSEGQAQPELVNASSSGLLSRLLQSGDLADPALPLLLGASLDIEGDQFIATYHYLRRVRNPPVIDNAMSSIINTLEFETYAKLWVWATTSAESSLLRILCSSDREGKLQCLCGPDMIGSGKIIRSRLAQILALMQAGTVDTVVLAVLWRDRVSRPAPLISCRAILRNPGTLLHRESCHRQLGHPLFKPGVTISSCVRSSDYTARRCHCFYLSKDRPVTGYDSGLGVYSLFAFRLLPWADRRGSGEEDGPITG